MDLSGKRAVITGAGSGIGRAIAIELAARGARTLISDISEARLAETSAEIGGEASWVVCDVSDHAQVEKLAESAQAILGGVDLAFVNAGVISSGRVTAITASEVDWILGVNVRGAWSTASIFARLMIEQHEGGRICFTGSEHSIGFQHNGAALYTASKHALLGLAEVMRSEMPDHVAVSIFCPGLVATALGQGARPANLPQVGGNKAFSDRVQARGMSAQEAAVRAIDGVLRGDFYIVTHPHAFTAAERRYEELKAAFTAQAPWYDGAEKYEVNRVIADVARELSQEKASKA